MSGWRLAKSLETFRAQQNKAAPDRSKASDGTIASAQHHTQNPDSDHEPNEHDVVQAFDDTDDPAHGADMDKLAERIRRDRDKRVKYVIDNKRMFSSYAAHGVPAWTWRLYTGADPHTGHLHISVVDDPKLYDDPRPWACFQEDDDMADVMVPTSDNNPHHKPGTLLPLAQYLQELEHETFANRSLLQQAMKKLDQLLAKP